MRTSRRFLTPCVLAALLLVGSGCASLATRPTGPPPERDIPAAFQAAAEAWNRRDVEAHVSMYADSTTFMTGRGPVVGRQRTADLLRASFFQDGQPVQQLRFESIVVRRLGPAHALTTGHFILSGGGAADQSGWFSTVWALSPQGWQIIHDHSS